MEKGRGDEAKPRKIFFLKTIEYTQIQRLQHISEFDLSQFYLTSPIREKVNTLTSPVGDEI